jgi:hypothetical protein
MSTDIAQQLDSIRQIALQAIEDDDWTAVVKQCTKAEFILSTVPDSRIGNMSDLEWDRAAIRNLRKRAEDILAQGDGSCDLDICNVEYEGIKGGSCGCSA